MKLQSDKVFAILWLNQRNFDSISDLAIRNSALLQLNWIKTNSEFYESISVRTQKSEVLIFLLSSNCEFVSLDNEIASVKSRVSTALIPFMALLGVAYPACCGSQPLAFEVSDFQSFRLSLLLKASEFQASNSRVSTSNF